jgi:hypothetical protein
VTKLLEESGPSDVPSDVPEISKPLFAGAVLKRAPLLVVTPHRKALHDNSVKNRRLRTRD